MGQYLMNRWYQAGWVNEIETGSLSRILLGRRMLFWRQASGALVAMEDRCPHRFAPLSLGEIRDDVVTCLYHGLAFAADGRCLHGLMADPSPPNARVQTFPVIERDSILWFWPGDVEAADEALIADFAFLNETPGFTPYFGYEHVHANYQLVVDNLMDTTHIELVHRGSFASPGVVRKGRFNIDREGDVLYNHFWIEGMTPDQVWPEPVSPAASYDRWIDMRWHAPSIMQLNIGTMPQGTVPERGSHVDYPSILQSHILTPETATTSHYFWALQDRLVGEREESGKLPAILKKAFSEEDKPVLEAVQGNMHGTNFWAERPVILPTDRGAVLARRIVDGLMREEQGGRTVNAPSPAIAADA